MKCLKKPKKRQTPNVFKGLKGIVLFFADVIIKAEKTN